MCVGAICHAWSRGYARNIGARRRVLFILPFRRCFAARPTMISGTRSNDRVINDKRLARQRFSVGKPGDIQLGNSPIANWAGASQTYECQAIDQNFLAINILLLVRNQERAMTRCNMQIIRELHARKIFINILLFLAFPYTHTHTHTHTHIYICIL